MQHQGKVQLKQARDCAISDTAPLRRCADCQHDLGDAISAAYRCPLFGQRRAGVEIRCLAFQPRRRRPGVDAL